MDETELRVEIRAIQLPCMATVTGIANNFSEGPTIQVDYYGCVPTRLYTPR